MKRAFIVEVDSVFPEETAECIRDLIHTEIQLANAGDDHDSNIGQALFGASCVEVRCLGLISERR